MVSRGPKGSGRGAAGDAEADLSTRRAARATPIGAVELVLVVGGGGPLFPGPHGPAGFGLPSHYPVVPLPSRGHALPTPPLLTTSPSFRPPSLCPRVLSLGDSRRPATSP